MGDRIAVNFSDLPFGTVFYQTRTATEGDIKIKPKAGKGRVKVVNARGVTDKIHSFIKKEVVYLDEDIYGNVLRGSTLLD